MAGFPEIQSVVELLQFNVIGSLPKETPANAAEGNGGDEERYAIQPYAGGNPKRIADRLSVIASLK